MNNFSQRIDESFLILRETVPAHFYVPALFIIWVFGLWIIKSVIFRRLKKWASTTTNHWDDVIVNSLSFPVNFLILASGLAIILNTLPLPDEIKRVVTIGFQASIIFAIILFVDRFSKKFLEEYRSEVFFGQVSLGLVKGLVRGFIIGIGILIFLQLIGISITPILASLGVGSLAVALALQDTLSNFFAGVYVAVDKPVQVGQFIRLESGEEGYVTDVGWRSTRLRTLPNNTVIIPNSKLVGSVVTNYYMPDKEIAVLVQVGVHYASDLAHVERVTCEVGKEIMQKVQGGVSEFAPFIRLHTFADSSVNFTVILRGKEFVDQHLIKHEFIKALHARYKKEGIVIPFPIRTIEFAPGQGQLLQGRAS
jgi:small-conductance mechanosensitive channel